jgi:hypothetical protein
MFSPPGNTVAQVLLVSENLQLVESVSLLRCSDGAAFVQFNLAALDVQKIRISRGIVVGLVIVQFAAEHACRRFDGNKDANLHGGFERKPDAANNRHLGSRLLRLRNRLRRPSPTVYAEWFACSRDDRRSEFHDGRRSIPRSRSLDGGSRATEICTAGRIRIKFQKI